RGGRQRGGGGVGVDRGAVGGPASGWGSATSGCALRAVSSTFSCTRPGRSSARPNSTAFGLSSIELDRSGPSLLYAGPRSSRGRPVGGADQGGPRIASVPSLRGHRVARLFAPPPAPRGAGRRSWQLPTLDRIPCLVDDRDTGEALPRDSCRGERLPAPGGRVCEASIQALSWNGG